MKPQFKEVMAEKLRPNTPYYNQVHLWMLLFSENGGNLVNYALAWKLRKQLKP